MNSTFKNSSQPSRPNYSLDPKNLPFGKVYAPNMFRAVYRNGAWEQGELVPLANLSLHPAALVFHYAQAIFEGLKGYRTRAGGIALFRPEINAHRFNLSAERMSMPSFPEELFVEAVKATVQVNANFIPNEPGTLYLRPTMIATEPQIGVRSSSEYLFYILALPSGAYFSGGQSAVDVMVSESSSRAAPGGTGFAKAAANYAISLKTIQEAKDRGCSQVLFLDAASHRYIEELGGMNVFISDGKRIITPEIHDTILNGVTRRSLIELAPTLGLEVEERRISIDEIRTGLKNRTVTEVIACGTAAVIAPIGSLLFSSSGERIEIGAGPVAKLLLDTLTEIQFGARQDTFNWTTPVYLA